MTPRAPARAWLPLLRFRPGGVGLGGATRGADSSVRDARGLNPVAVGEGGQNSGKLAEVRNEFSRCRPLEDSPSGLWRQLGKLVGCKPSGVRIPHSPQTKNRFYGGVFVCWGCWCGIRTVRGFLNHEVIEGHSPRGPSEAASYADSVTETTTGVSTHQEFTHATAKSPRSLWGFCHLTTSRYLVMLSSGT